MADRSGGITAKNALAQGAKDLPQNTVWAFSRLIESFGSTKDAASDTAPSAGENAADRAKRVGAGVKDAIPGVGGSGSDDPRSASSDRSTSEDTGSESSVGARLQQAHAAADWAREVERSAIHAAEQAQQLASEATGVAERDREHLQDIQRERGEQVDARVAEAQVKANRLVTEAREKAQSEAERELRQEREKAQDRLDTARDKAESARADAEKQVQEATEALAEARRLANQAAQVARQAADEMRSQADELDVSTDEAEQPGRDVAGRSAPRPEARGGQDVAVEETTIEVVTVAKDPRMA